MTFEDCVKNYDVAIYYDSGIQTKSDPGWYWAVECGYQSFDARKPQPTASEAEAELRTWLINWEGPTK